MAGTNGSPGVINSKVFLKQKQAILSLEGVEAKKAILCNEDVIRVRNRSVTMRCSPVLGLPRND